MRILFIPQAGALGLGGITRCLAVAEEAARRGHAVAFLTPQRYPLVDEYRIGDQFVAPQPLQAPNFGAGEAQTFAESLAVRGFGDQTYLHAAVASEIDVIRRFGADLVFTENQPTVSISARVVGIPYVATVASINLECFGSPNRTEAQSLSVTGSFARICRRFALSEPLSIETLLHGYASINFAPTAEFLEPLLVAVPRVQFTGPILFRAVEFAPVPRVCSAGTKILVYLSTGSVTVEELLPALVQAFPSPTFVLLIATRQSPADVVIRQYENLGVVFCRMPGISRALQQVDLMVTRGGQNTLMACLLAGRPVIGTPGHSAEPTFNLSVLEAHSIARTLRGVPSAGDLSAAGLILLEAAVAERARRLGDILRKHEGAVGVVRAIEHLCV